MKPLIKVLASLAALLAISVALPVLAQDSAQGVTASTDPDAIYQDLGGTDGIRKIVDAFLPLVINDTRIKHQFDDVDMKHLAKMLAEQFCQLSGGPCKYTGKDMHTIHADLGVTDAQFNALAEDLQTAMDQQGISARVQNKLVAELAPLRHQIVTK